jgi:hypothetical protein
MNTTSARAETISITDTAKLIRAQLAAHFPGTAFSVRSHRYSMGSHVSVQWVDGPSAAQVDRITDPFCGTTFDASDDSTHHHDTEVAGPDGQTALVHYQGSRPSCSRRITDETGWRQRAGAFLRARLDGITGEGAAARFGNDWVENLKRGMVYACDFREVDPLPRAYRIVIAREDVS